MYDDEVKLRDETIREPCPDCGGTLVLRRNRKNHSLFIACSEYPGCTFTKPLPEYLRMLMMGAPSLFDEEDLSSR